MSLPSAPAPPPPSLPGIIQSEEELDEVLSRPAPETVELARGLEGPLVILGAGGKMGPTFALLARRAVEAAGRRLPVIAASRFSSPGLRERLERSGISTVQVDLLEREEVRKLPDAPTVLYLAGQKFGTDRDPAGTWAVNTLAPAHAAERYAGSRMAALSTGNVYPLTPVTAGGSREEDPLTPFGEYSNAAVARERVLEHISRRRGLRLVLVRLNYAVELRYGVLVDLARKIWAGEPVDLSMGYLNCLWQGDACDMALRCLALASTPPLPLNLTGPEILPVRELALELGKLLEKPVRFQGTERETALLSNTSRAVELLGRPRTPLGAVLRWTAHWIRSGGRLLGKPTGFQVRDGRY